MDRRTRHVDNKKKYKHSVKRTTTQRKFRKKPFGVCVSDSFFQEGGGGEEEFMGGKKGTSGAGSLHLDTSSEACSSTTELNSVSSLK